jgi:hypothetical protein
MLFKMLLFQQSTKTQFAYLSLEQNINRKQKIWITFAPYSSNGSSRSSHELILFHLIYKFILRIFFIYQMVQIINLGVVVVVRMKGVLVDPVVMMTMRVKQNQKTLQ